MKQAVEMGSVTLIRIEFHNDWFRYSKFDRGDTQIYIYIYRQRGDRINLL
jgi:hypothetical protein